MPDVIDIALALAVVREDFLYAVELDVTWIKHSKCMLDNG